MATHCILSWRIAWTEEPGGPQSVGSQRVEHDRATDIANTTCYSMWDLSSPTEDRTHTPSNGACTLCISPQL